MLKMEIFLYLLLLTTFGPSLSFGGYTSGGLAAISRRGEPPSTSTTTRFDEGVLSANKKLPISPFTPLHHTTTGTGSTGKSSSKQSSIEDEDYDDYDDDLDDLMEDHEKARQEENKSWREDECPMELRGHCHCGSLRDPHNSNKWDKLINCTRARFRDAEFLRFIPDDTQRLIVRGNTLKELPINIFGRNRSHIALKEIDLSDNAIEIIHGRTFHHVPNVDTLILNFNRINADSLNHPRFLSNFNNLKYLHLTKAFAPNNHWLMESLLETFRESNLKKLLKLHLEQNGIERITDIRQFCDLPSLMDLHLGQNKLTDLRIENDPPSCLPSLRLIDLSYNEIKSVTNTTGIFQLMNRDINERGEPLQVDLYENPFHCDCHLQSYLNWLNYTRLRDADRIRHGPSLRCATAFNPSLENKMLFSLGGTQLECAPPLKTTNEIINTLSWTLLSFIVLTAFGLLIALYLHKAGVPSCLQRFLSNAGLQSPLLMTTTGVKYTSVEKEEAAEVAHV